MRLDHRLQHQLGPAGTSHFSIRLHGQHPLQHCTHGCQTQHPSTNLATTRHNRRTASPDTRLGVWHRFQLAMSMIDRCLVVEALRCGPCGGTCWPWSRAAERLHDPTRMTTSSNDSSRPRRAESMHNHRDACCDHSMRRRRAGDGRPLDPFKPSPRHIRPLVSVGKGLTIACST